MRVRVYDDTGELAAGAARDFVGLANGAIERSGRFAVALAGGSTPRETYRVLAAEHAGALDWMGVHAFFGDERAVPPDDEDSNYRMAQEALLDHVSVGGVHRMRGELDPAEAAALYERDLRAFFGEDPPRFDLVMLGIGEDGHTASLFPGTPALDVTDRLAVSNPVPKLETTRLTLTLPVLNAARAVWFLVAGSGKAGVLRGILEPDSGSQTYPAGLVRPDGELVWMLDREAASRLDP